MLICLYTNPRSGSSLIAKIFHAHGVWAGRALSNRGYQTHEWEALKHAIKPPGRGWTMDGTFISVDDQMRFRMEGLIKSRSGKWLFKGVPDYHPALEPYADRIIKIWRDPDSIIQSQGVDGFWRDVIYRRFELMDSLPGIDVNTDDIMAGDFSSLESAFDYCGLEFNADLAEQQIDPDLWHHRC